MIHSSKDTRGKPSHCLALVKAYDMSYQDFCTPAAFKKKTSIYEGTDFHAYGYPQRLSSDAWNAYANNPFDLLTRKIFLSEIFLICMDKMKETTKIHPYAIHFENVTSDVRMISNNSQKIDARNYNGYLIITGIVYHLTSISRNSLLNERFGKPLEVGMINFIVRYGNYMQRLTLSQNSWSILQVL